MCVSECVCNGKHQRGRERNLTTAAICNHSARGRHSRSRERRKLLSSLNPNGPHAPP